MKTPWAVLLTRFQDDNSEPYPRHFYEQLFTATGVGSQNMVDFFHDVSHGTLDLSDSKVFPPVGWLELKHDKSEYKGSGTNAAGRSELIAWAKQAATAAQIDLTGFFGIVVCMNVPTDLFGYLGQPIAVCDSLSMDGSLLGQEMGHGYGLDHSRLDGLVDDYRDPWDTMSTGKVGNVTGAYMAPHPVYHWIGPSLNAWNMRGRGWLDESRVWRGGDKEYDITMQLRPLIRHDLQGFLAVDLEDGHLLEFRVQEGWDAAIPRPVILLHYFQQNHSYLVHTPQGFEFLEQGDTIEFGAVDRPFDPYRRVEVVSIDPATRVATLRLSYRPAIGIPYEVAGGTILWGGIKVDAGGAIMVGGRIIHIPPWDPTLRFLEQIALFKSSELAEQPVTREAMQRKALTAITDHAEKMMARISPLRVPAPLSDEQQPQQADKQPGDPE